MALKIWHDRPNCIACGACAAACPQNWQMDPIDGLASVIEADISEEQRAANQEAAEVCPVNIIHLAQDDEVPNYFSERGISVRPSGKRD